MGDSMERPRHRGRLRALPRGRRVHLAGHSQDVPGNQRSAPRQSGAAELLDRSPSTPTDLCVEVEGVYQGMDTLVICYRNQDRGLVNEVLKFDGDLDIEGHGTYLVEE